MKKNYVPLFIVLLVRCSSSNYQEHPNILILYADDLGWSDIVCYGSKINGTPLLDKLASEGLRFTDAYAAAPICSASRASIMTGKSPARLNFKLFTKLNDVNARFTKPNMNTIK